MTDVLRWGVLGVASIGNSVLPAMRGAERTVLTAIASRDRARAQQAADGLGIPVAVGSYDELLERDDVDAVYIPLPNHLHAEWTIAAAEAGKHVLCEKPLAMDAAQAITMVEACEKNGVVLAEAFMYRHNPLWQRVHEIVANGSIGEVRSIVVRFAYSNVDPQNIRNRTESGGGALMDIGCYAIDTARWLYGTEPETVAAQWVIDDSFGTDVSTSALLGFGTGQAIFSVATRAEPDQHVAISGSEGRIEVPIPFNPPGDRPTEFRIYAGGDSPVSPGVETFDFPPRDQYAAQAEDFAAVVLDDTAQLRPAEEAIKTMEIIDRIRASASRPGYSSG